MGFDDDAAPAAMWPEELAGSKLIVRGKWSR
jgi:hypothetical protein